MDKSKTGFGSHLTDMGNRKPEGMEPGASSAQAPGEPKGFFGTALDMGQKDAVGVGDGK